MTVHCIRPLSDRRWDELVARHPQASAFHQRAWLEALSRTYGYELLALTSASADQPMRDGVVVCKVRSWITGTRLVSLPFSDHCDFLWSEDSDQKDFSNGLRAVCEEQHCRYFEVRPLMTNLAAAPELSESGAYCFHVLDLSPSAESLFRAFHKDSIQRKIRRAEKEKLQCESGVTAALLDEFYRLLLMTRRRHHMLPQPRAWFRNLVKASGSTAEIRVARKDGHAIAAVLVLRHRNSVVYKYGCSDERVHQLGGMPLLFWNLVEESKEAGFEHIDFGRSDLDQQGLMTFKDRLGARRRLLKYYRSRPAEKKRGRSWWKPSSLLQAVPYLPDACLSAAGGVLYRHFG